MKTLFGFASIALLLGLTPVGAEVDCYKLGVTVKHAVTARTDAVLEIVQKHMEENPGCACEIVKAAIVAAEAEPETVAAIVEVAATVAPDQLRLISQCAVAVAPDALAAVQKVVAKLDPGKGESTYSGKNSKSPKGPIEVKPAWNPLDFPGEGFGPNPGGQGGYGFLPPDNPWGNGQGGGGVVVPPVGTQADFGIRFYNRPQ